MKIPESLKEEPEDIVAALDILSAPTKESGEPEYVRFAEKPTSHAWNEEEILYPAAILIGEHLRMKFRESEIEKKANRK